MSFKLFNSQPKLSQNVKYLIIGAGDAAVSVSSLIRKHQLVKSRHDVKLMDLKKTYWYQSGQTKVGAGINTLKQISIKNSSRFPFGTVIIKNKVEQVFPDENYVKCVDGTLIGYETLIIATGTEPVPHKTPGLKEALQDPSVPVASVYLPDFAEKYAKLRKEFQGGTVLFCQPKSHIKCQGATQKLMYTSCCDWKGKKKDVQFHTGTEKMLNPEYYHKKLLEIAKGYGINISFKSELVEVRPKERIAVVEGKGGKKEIKFDLLHVAPLHEPAEFIAKSKLGSSEGYVDVDPYTLRHKKYENIWALGDCAELPTSKTLSAVNTQIHILVHNLKAIASNGVMEKYNGYTACPIMTDKKRVLMCEFGYEDKLMPTFHQKPKPSRFTGFIYRHIFRLTSLYGMNIYIKPMQIAVKKVFRMLRL